MKKTQRVRQEVSQPVGEAELKQRIEQGWKLIALEWEREVETADDRLPADVPFGLQISADTRALEENPSEKEILFNLMELMLQEGSYARIADEINRRGFRTRQGTLWSAVTVFEMLPRLIEVDPHMFHSPEWQTRKPVPQRSL